MGSNVYRLEININCYIINIENVSCVYAWAQVLPPLLSRYIFQGSWVYVFKRRMENLILNNNLIKMKEA